MAGIDRRVAAGEHRQERRLRPAEHEGDLEVAVGLHFLEVGVPELARILADERLVLRRVARERVPGALHVGRRERLAVVPLHALPQLEGELRLVGIVGPAFGQLRHDMVGTVHLLLRIEEDEVVEHRHEGLVHRDGRFLVDRGARRIVAMGDAQGTARLLGEHRRRRRHKAAQDAARTPDAYAFRFSSQTTRTPNSIGLLCYGASRPSATG